MLPPDTRQLYVEALAPPVGYELADAVATTYSLDLDTLLAVPISMALPGLDARRVKENNPVALLESVRRISSKLSVFCNVASIHPSRGEHVLYGLLEPVITEVRAPRGGCLHAKLWALRFVGDGKDSPLLRLVVLSRNLTQDRSWDVALRLEGRLGRARSANRALSELLLSLIAPGVAIREPNEPTVSRVTSLANDLRHADWELPQGFDEVAFHVLGLDGRVWRPPSSDRLVVVSPFIELETLKALSETTDRPIALISRSEELDRVTSPGFTLFSQRWTLSDAAELEDGEEPQSGLLGLHAKVYICKHGWDTRVCVGSANATPSGLGVVRDGAKNIELMAELVGKTSKVGGVDTLLSESGLGTLLMEYEPPPEPAPADSAAMAAETALEDFAVALAMSLEVRFEVEAGSVVPRIAVVSGEKKLVWPSVLTAATAWLTTTQSATSILPLEHDESVCLPPCAVASATGIVGFELTAESTGSVKLFATNLRVVGLPADRDAEVTLLLVKNQRQLFTYLLALLAEGEAELLTDATGSSDANGWAACQNVSQGLLEHLLRACSRAPERVAEAEALIASLRSTEQGRAILSQEFLEVWNTIVEARP